jgi:hypothetical protein
MRLKNVLTHVAVAASLGVAAPAAFAAPDRPVAAQHTERIGTPAPAQVAEDDASRYAALEKQDQKAADFRGGDTVVIAMSTGAVIVAIVLLVLLL